MFITCCEHGHIYGFHMMIDPEGRKDLYHMLYERFPQDALDQLTIVCEKHSALCSTKYNLLVDL